MNNVVSKVLLIIIIFLVALFAYKTVKTPSAVSDKVVINSEISKSENQQDEVAKTEKIVKEYLLKNPEVIIQAIEILQHRKRDEMEAKASEYIKNNQAEVSNSSASPIVGNPEGNITIVAFYDYNCSYCKKGDSYIEQLIQSDKNVKVVLKPFPILGDSSFYVSSIALAVYKLEPSKFSNIHNGLMAMSNITKESVEKLLLDNDLDPVVIEEEAGKENIREALTKNGQLARNLKIQGVPAYIINGKLVPGMMDFEQLKNIISNYRRTQ
ncbi:MAG: DsbA family protein [Candidatus Rickettsia vulgarisii]